MPPAKPLGLPPTGAMAGEPGELAAEDVPIFMRSRSNACALFIASPSSAPPPPGRPANDDDPTAGFRALPRTPSAVELR